MFEAAGVSCGSLMLMDGRGSVKLVCWVSLEIRAFVLGLKLNCSPYMSIHVTETCTLLYILQTVPLHAN